MTANSSTYTTMMRTTRDQRPYTKDLFDLFAALLLQLRLTDHRSLFRTYADTFTTDEAVQCLADLKCTHIVRTVSRDDPKQQLATRTTTTFSMTPPMAKALGTHMLNARLIEDAVNPQQNRTMKDKGIWRPTPKGKHMVLEFARRAEITISLSQQQQLARIDSFGIFAFERLQADDQLSFNRANMVKAFKMMLAWLPTERLIADDVVGVKAGDLNSYQHTFYGYQCLEWVSEYTTVATCEEAQMITTEFVICGWICEISDHPAEKHGGASSKPLERCIAKNSLYYVADRGYRVLRNGGVTTSMPPPPRHANKQPDGGVMSGDVDIGVNDSDTEPLVLNSSSSKYTLAVQSTPSLEQQQQQYYNSKFRQPQQYGMDTMTRPLSKGHSNGGSSQDSGLGWGGIQQQQQQQHKAEGASSSSSSTATTTTATTAATATTDVLGAQNQLRDSNWVRLRQILEDPLTRMYFRDFLKTNFCEENLNFWVDYHTLRRRYIAQESTQDMLTDCYKIYASYVAPGSASEVNIEHAVRGEIIAVMTRNFTVMIPTPHSLPFSTDTAQLTLTHNMTVDVSGPGDLLLGTMIQLYDRVNHHICRIMAEDAVPRFIRTPKYRELVHQSP